MTGTIFLHLFFLATLYKAVYVVSGNELIGRTCLNVYGDPGTCTISSRCQGQASRSPTCGSALVCCKGRRRASSAIIFPGELDNRIRGTTRRPPTSRATTRRTNILNSVSCGHGLLTSQVFGGDESKIKDFPFVVSFVIRNRGTVENFCGGSLLTARHVLTAAHCFDRVSRENVDVRIGLSDVRSREKDQNKANILHIKIHEKYQRNVPGQDNSVNDIAIVTLDRNIPIGVTRNANNVCLPIAPRRKLKSLLVVGFGATTTRADATSENRLHSANVNEVSRFSCQDRFNQFLSNSLSVKINKDMICAGDEESDSCAGDSGAPLLWLDDTGRWTVGGLVSFGPSSCANVVPGVYTRVHSFIDWIKQQIL